MGEYEDRYPEAYGRGEEVPTGPAEEGTNLVGPPRQVRDTLRDQRDIKETGHERLRERPRDAAPISSAPAGRGEMHGPYRGVGPRGYTRAAERIREDVCDRLTEDPFIDASDIEVFVTGTEVFLRGVVENRVAQRQAQSIAEDVVGVRRVDNELRVREAGERREPHSPGAAVNAAMGSPPPRRY